MSFQAGVALAVMLLVGCEGQIGGLGGPRLAGGNTDIDSISGSLSCQVIDTGFQPLRRLSARQIDNSLRDLFGGELGEVLVAIAGVPDTKISAGFSTDADANTVNSATSTGFEQAAKAISAYLVDNAADSLPAVMPCAANSSSDAEITSCIDQFIEEFGLRVYRRPLTFDEASLLRDVYDDVRNMQSAIDAWAAVIQVMVQSPQFLYLAEEGGAPVTGTSHLVELDDYEMASRLSYFLNETMPDEELFAAAAAGELRSKEQIEDQARRLVAKDDVVDVLASFHSEWLGLYDFDMLAKSPNAYPSFGPAAASAMAGEIHELTEHVMDELDGSVTSLLSATDWQVPQALAAVYGLSGPGLASDGLSPRAGALTTSAFLAMHAYEDNSSVIRRGVFIRRAVLCGDLPPPQITDDQRDSVLGPAAEANTARERLAPLTQSGQCASCHEAINPIGLGLENFDAVGQWRDTENGAVIDPAGEIDGAGDANGSFDDPLGLVDLIANSLTVQQCYSQKLVRFALGRLIGPEDSCTVDDLKYVAQESGGDIREMLVGMTLTHSFRFRRSSQ